MRIIDTSRKTNKNSMNGIAKINNEQGRNVNDMQPLLFEIQKGLE